MTESTTTDEPAKIISDLLVNMNDWQIQNLNAVRAALDWLRKMDHPALALRVSVRDMMERQNT